MLFPNFFVSNNYGVTAPTFGGGVVIAPFGGFLFQDFGGTIASPTNTPAGSIIMNFGVASYGDTYQEPFGGSPQLQDGSLTFTTCPNGASTTDSDHGTHVLV